jgi:uncharacterized protein (TIGR02145 family)
MKVTSKAFLILIIGTIISYSCKKETEKEVIIFEKGTVTDVEGFVYPTVKIGKLWWMAQNLRTTKYNDGTSIPLIVSNIEWIQLTTPGYCWYANDFDNYGTVYGGLYNWYAHNTGKLCPIGWHIPTDNEWHNLALNLDPNSVWAGNSSESAIAGGKLKEAGTDHWLDPNTGATNKTGFSALPGGARWIPSGNFEFIGETGYWSCRDESAYRAMTYVNSSLFRGYSSNEILKHKRTGNSVRCVKDY